MRKTRVQRQEGRERDEEKVGRGEGRRNQRRSDGDKDEEEKKITRKRKTFSEIETKERERRKEDLGVKPQPKIATLDMSDLQLFILFLSPFLHLFPFSLSHTYNSQTESHQSQRFSSFPVKRKRRK